MWASWNTTWFRCCRKIRPSTSPANLPWRIPTSGSILLPGTYASFRQIATNSNASYHSLETSLSRRFSQGLTFIGSYTFGKLLDYYSAQNLGQTPQNPYNERLDRARSDEDRNQVFSGSFVYDIPFLRDGRSWVSRLPEAGPFPGW